MSNWKTSQIKDFGRVVTGYTPPTINLQLWGGDIPFYSPTDFNDDVYCTKTERKINSSALSNDRIVQENSLMVTCIASIGKIALATKRGITNQQINSILFNESFDPKYCYYLIKNNINELIKLGGTTAVPIVNKADFEKINLRHHSEKSEQRQIARILSTCDAVIEKTQAAIAKYKAIKQGMLQDLFTRGVKSEKVKVKNEKGEWIEKEIWKLRPRYEDAPHLYKKSKLGWIPKEWDCDSIDNLTDKVGSGVTPTGGSEVYKTQGILFLRSQNVLNGKLSLNDVAFIPNEIDEIMENSRVRPFDVLLNITGASIGRCAYFPEELFNANVNQHVCIIRFKNPFKSLAVFASEYLNTDFGQRQIFKAMAVGNREGLNYQQIKAFNFVEIRDQKELEKIATIIENLNDKLQIEQGYLQKMQAVKKGLMEDLLSGKVKVKSEKVEESEKRKVKSEKVETADEKQ